MNQKRATSCLFFAAPMQFSSLRFYSLFMHFAFLSLQIVSDELQNAATKLVEYILKKYQH